jgi:CubicO group peptidase (beta-lactamase class C family)
MHVVAGLCALLALTQQPTPTERFPAALDRYIAQVLVDGKIPGLAISVVRNDSVLVAKGYGVRELGKPDRVDENTIFDAASLTKSFTSTLAAVLVDRGQLRWDDPVQRYIPNLVLSDSVLTRTATLRDFLSHRTGLEANNMAWVLTAVDRPEMLRRMRYVRAAQPPGQSMIYSNLGYMIAGEAIAAAGRKSYEDLLRDVLIKPLRLQSTTTYEESFRKPNVASPHANIAGRQQPVRRETQRDLTAAGGTIQSSATDLARWMRLHLNNGMLDGIRYVSDSAMRAMHSLQVVIPTTATMRAARLVQDTVAGYGMGLQVMDYRSHPLLWHTGNGDGQIAYMALLPRDRLGVVVLVNTWSAPLIHAAIVNRTLDTYLGYESRDWAAEMLARVPAQLAARDSAVRAMEEMKSTAPPPLPLASYAARYDSPLYGPIWVRVESAGLTLRMGEGQVADLEYHGGNAFFTRWRDPLFAENFGTHAEFAIEGDRVTGLTMTPNRERITASRP